MTFSPTINVSFWLKKAQPRHDKTVPIYARVRVSGRFVDISTREFILRSNWSSSARRVKENSPHSERINFKFEKINSEIKNAFKELLDEGQVITAKAVKKRFLGEDSLVLTCKQLMAYHRKNELKKLAPGTAKNYKSTETYLSRFINEKYNSDDIKLRQINYSFIVQFENYLRTCSPLNKSCPLHNNGIMKHMERFQKLITLARKHEWISKNPFALYQLKFEGYDCSFLDQSEIHTLSKLSLSKGSLSKVRDIFIFSCYTGLAYSEVKNLKKRNLVEGIDGELWIMIRRQKTKTSVKLPLLNEAKRILKEYKNYPHPTNDNSLFPIPSNQKVNRYLKEIAKLAKIDIDLTFHMARHTFATTVTLLNDVPLETVSKMLGHTKLSTTQRYARVIEKKISKDMAALKMKLQAPNPKNGHKKTTYNHLTIIE